MPGSRALLLVAEPLLGAAGFLAALAVFDRTGFNPLPLEDYGASLAISVGTFWAAGMLRDDSPEAPAWKIFQELFCISLGLNLLAQALLAYSYTTLLLESLPFVVLLGGSFLSSLLLTAAWGWLDPESANDTAGVLLVGFDSVGGQVVEAMKRPVLGVVGAEPARVPAAYPYLGGMSELERAVEARRPGQILVSHTQSEASPMLLELLEQRINGVPVEPAAAVYERLFDRTSVRSLHPIDFFSSSRLFTDRRTLALQSIYNNLIGLTLLALLLPVIIVLALSIRIFSGPGPGIEAVECVGFQNIPFQMLQFRTRRRDGRGTTKLGRVLLSLHMVSLPQLFNLIRGEMVLFGPRPVRVEYADRLSALIPFYLHRFSVKPGILSWAQIRVHASPVVPDDLLRLEYDLFYIKQSSPMLDVEIFFMALFGRRESKTGTEGVFVHE